MLSLTMRKDLSMLTKFIENETSLHRFLIKIGEPTDSGCWPWLGKKSGVHGYGGFMLNTQANTHIGAHVASFIIFNRDYVQGLDVSHVCDNPNCVNPKHLVLMSHRDNMLDSVSKKRHPTIGRVGAANPAYKVSPEKFNALLVELRNGLKGNSELAKEFGVSSRYVSMVRGGYRRVGDAN